MAAKDLSDKELDSALSKLGKERYESDQKYRKEMLALKAEQERRAAKLADVVQLHPEEG